MPAFGLKHFILSVLFFSSKAENNAIIQDRIATTGNPIILFAMLIKVGCNNVSVSSALMEKNQPPVKICFNIAIASVTLPARKNTQVMLIKANVNIQRIILGNFSYLLFVIRSSTIAIPCISPQRKKVKPAPCHNPLTKNTIRIFR